MILRFYFHLNFFFGQRRFKNEVPSSTSITTNPYNMCWNKIKKNPHTLAHTRKLTSSVRQKYKSVHNHAYTRNSRCSTQDGTSETIKDINNEHMIKLHNCFACAKRIIRGVLF